jgi:hypothetical protein
MGGMSTPSGPRSIKISDDERGAWTSDRPRRDGRPPRPLDVSVRSRVLRPADRMRYSPGSLLVIVAPVRAERDRFVQRVVEERGALMSLDKVRTLLTGRLAEEEIEERAQQLLDAAVAKRLQANESIVLAADTLGREERERYVRLAAAAERPRHIILVEAGSPAEEDRAALNELRRSLDAGEMGAEGFHTALRVGGAAVSELKKVLFRPPPRDD